MIYFLCSLLFLIGLLGIVLKRNLIKIVISLTIVEYSLFMFLALVGYKHDAVPPIVTSLTEKNNYVDPLPQALVLTGIVIGLATTALLVALAVRIYEKYGTFDIREVRRLKG
jgi:multisubunit Na+/H+ antiporter MnhC subunit